MFFINYIFDLDGVIWKEGILIQGAKELIMKLRSQNKNILFISNNSLLSKIDYIKKFKTLGIHILSHEILSTSYLTAFYLKKYNIHNIYLIGENSFIQELNNNGIFSIKNSDNIDETDNIDAVVCGLDRNFNYQKLLHAITYLQTTNCKFIATNLDSFKMNGNIRIPGNGCFIQAIKTVTDKEPILIGKPSDFLKDFIKEEYNFDPQRTCFIGDRLDTDMNFANKLGYFKILVLTGCTTKNDLKGNEQLVDLVLDSIADLI